MALGVGGRELAAGIAGAGDQAAADRALYQRPERPAPPSPPMQTPTCGPARQRSGSSATRWKPDRYSIRSVRRIAAITAHLLGGEPADRQAPGRDSCGPACFSAMHADMAVLVGHRSRRDHRAGRRGAAAGRIPSRPSATKASRPMRSSTYFSRAFGGWCGRHGPRRRARRRPRPVTHSSGFSRMPVSKAKSRWPVMPPSCRWK